MYLRRFISEEIRKALGRLRATVIFVLKAFFVAVVNVVFWFLPLVISGYFLAKPMFYEFHRMVERSEAAVLLEHEGMRIGQIEGTKRKVNMSEMSSLVSHFLRDIKPELVEQSFSPYRQ